MTRVTHRFLIGLTLVPFLSGAGLVVSASDALADENRSERRGRRSADGLGDANPDRASRRDRASSERRRRGDPDRRRRRDEATANPRSERDGNSGRRGRRDETTPNRGRNSGRPHQDATPPQRRADRRRRATPPPPTRSVGWRTAPPPARRVGTPRPGYGRVRPVPPRPSARWWAEQKRELDRQEHRLNRRERALTAHLGELREAQARASRRGKWHKPRRVHRFRQRAAEIRSIEAELDAIWAERRDIEAERRRLRRARQRRARF